MRRFAPRAVGVACVLGVVAVAAPACSSSKTPGSAVQTTGPAGATATTATGATTGGAGNTSSAPGITPTKVTVGLVTSLTGPESAQFDGAKQGVEARLDLQNAQGGVDGRQIQLTTADDASTPTQAASAAQSLITEKGAFALLFVSGVTATAYKVPQQQGVPVVGAPVDGAEWGQQPNTNMFGVPGDEGPTGLTESTELPNLMKLVGATNVASLGYGNEPASAYSAKLFTAVGSSRVDLQACKLEYSIVSPK